MESVNPGVAFAAFFRANLHCAFGHSTFCAPPLKSNAVREMEALENLSDKGLEDIGLEPSRRDFDAVKPFWMP